jgi:tetratricopeptide (TPR) repeat protein
VILFTGYIETYSLLTAWLAIFIFCGIKYLNDQFSLQGLLLVFGLGIFWHIWFIAFIPALLYLVSRRHLKLPDLFLTVITVLYIIGIYVGGRMIVRSGIPPVMPLIPTADSNYSLFSTAHLLDFVNQIIMVGPLLPLMGLILLIGIVFNKPSNTARFMIWLGLPAVAIAFMIDPALGAIRDWDLLSLFAFPVILGAVYLLGRMNHSGKGLYCLLLPIIILNLYHISGFVINNNDTRSSAYRMLEILSEDPHYQKDYYAGLRNIPLSSILLHQYNDNHAALEFARRRVESPEAEYSDFLYVGNICHETGLMDDALTYFEKVPPGMIDDPYILYAYGNSLGYNNRYDEADSLLRMALEDTSFFDLYASMAYTQLYNGKLDSSKKYIELGLKSSKDSLAVLDRYTNILSSNEHYGQAIEYQKRLINIFPDSAVLVSQLAMFYIDAGLTDSAMYYFDQMLNFSPDSGRVYLSAAETLYNEELFDEALGYYRKSQLYNPGRLEVLYGLGKTYHKLDNYDSALSYLNRSYAINPNVYGPAARLAQIYFELDQLENSLAVLEQVLRNHPDDSDLLIRKAVVLGRLNRHEDVLESLLRLMQFDPGNSQAQYLIGVSQLELGQPEAAIGTWENLLQKSPGYIPVYYNLARAHDLLGNNVQAWRMLQKWLQLNPEGANNPDARKLLNKYDLID